MTLSRRQFVGSVAGAGIASLAIPHPVRADNGGPIRMEADLVRLWLSLVAIKDMLPEKQKDVWQYHVVPVGDGIVRWNEVGQALKDAKFNGTISLHGEYETKDLAERKRLAKKELDALKKLVG